MNREKIQELQILEQTLQNLLAQKQAFQMEFSETDSALKEIEKSGDEVFKIVGQIMLKVGKDKMKEDLLGKEKILEIRLKTIERQENTLMEKLEKIREAFVDSKNN